MRLYRYWCHIPISSASKALNLGCYLSEVERKLGERGVQGAREVRRTNQIALFSLRANLKEENGFRE